ncbi:MAG: hypothetical protein PHG91_00565 [Syntrophales bacterium]|nr:hypothetical protein [Syntrophales bacterium]MDD5231862.1 hypothetical protein [Syntrophales bacterium]MDD5532273.1 hypothetical protein [Syntrophales bacterium]
MRFGHIDSIILFGGAPLLAEFALTVAGLGEFDLAVFSSERHLEEVIPARGEKLETILKDNSVPFYSSPDINSDPRIRPLITPNTLGIGLGETWSFDSDLIYRFGGRLLDFMGIRLPQYRGGAHYSWQILRKNRIGCCNLQIINEDMIQGVFDSGAIVKSREYFFPPCVRIPQDYFDHAVREEIDFLTEFLAEVRAGKEFSPFHVQENFSIYFPRLYTPKHGLIDWRWTAADIELFVCAFDEPYMGASTFLDGKRVFLKDCRLEFNDGPFHPFQKGLIYKKANRAVFAAAGEGTLVIRKISDENGADIFDLIGTGMRFYTPANYLEEAMLYRADYDSQGIKKE